MTLNEYIRSMNEHIVPHITYTHEYLKNETLLVYVNDTDVYSLMIYGLGDYGLKSIHITSDTIAFYKKDHHYHKSDLRINYISTEEEHFQESLIQDLSNYDLEFFKICKDLFWNAYNSITYIPVGPKSEDMQ